MEQDELLRLLADAAAARENLDDDCKASLNEKQITVLNRKLDEIKNEKERVFQTMADAIMVGKNHLEAYLKLEKHINNEIEALKKEFKNVRKGA